MLNRDSFKNISFKETIFFSLCDPKDYKHSPYCQICNFSNNVSNFEICKFCGLSICSIHFFKTRCDPKNLKKYEKICEKCDRKYIYKQIYEDYLIEKTNLEKLIEVMEEKQKKLSEESNLKLEAENNMKMQKKESNTAFTKNLEDLTTKIIKEEEKIENLSLIIEQKTASNTIYDQEIDSLKSEINAEYSKNIIENKKKIESNPELAKYLPSIINPKAKGYDYFLLEDLYTSKKPSESSKKLYNCYNCC